MGTCNFGDFPSEVSSKIEDHDAGDDEFDPDEEFDPYKEASMPQSAH